MNVFLYGIDMGSMLTPTTVMLCGPLIIFGLLSVLSAQHTHTHTAHLRSQMQQLKCYIKDPTPQSSRYTAANFFLLKVTMLLTISVH